MSNTNNEENMEDHYYPNEVTEKGDHGTEKITEEEWVDVLGSGDLKMKTLEQGEPGSRPQNTDVCTIDLVGKLEDGTIVESYDKAIVEANGNDVVQGVDLVLTLMDVGQKVEIIIKPRFAYGSSGDPKTNIPPNSTIFYTLKLWNASMAPELVEVSFDCRREKSLKKKERGNWWYSRGDGHKAIQCYRAAINQLADSTPFVNESGSTDMPEEVFREFVQIKLTLYNNLAAAQIMVEALEPALQAVENVLQIEPENVKALFRKGKILASKGLTDEAVEIFQKTSLLSPDNSAIKKEYQLCLLQQAKEKTQAKTLYKKMFSSSPVTKHSDKKRSHHSLVSMQPIWECASNPGRSN